MGEGKGKAVSNFPRNIALWVIIALLLLALFNLFQGSNSRGSSSSLYYTNFLSDVEAGRVRDVVIQGRAITGHYSNGNAFNAII